MKNKGCDCSICKKCCWHSMGWFGSVSEVRGAAKLMNMSVKNFAQKYLIREWYAGGDEASVPAPRKNFSKPSKDKQEEDEKVIKLLKRDIWKEEIKKNGKGFVRASWGHNLMTGYACIFLDENEKCIIHDSKPKECRLAFGCKPNSRDLKIRPKIAKYWSKHQDFIDSLLDKELVSNCCGYPAQNAGEGETELCGDCKEGCVIVDISNDE